MELKKYQLRVLDEVKVYLNELARQQTASNRHAALDAWETARVPGRGYVERRNGLGKDMPNFCLKVPTGGGKIARHAGARFDLWHDSGGPQRRRPRALGGAERPDLQGHTSRATGPK